MKIVKHASAALVLALAAGGLGCAAPVEEAPAPVEERATLAQQQQPITQVLAGVQGIVNLVGMIKQTVAYGHPIATGDIYAEQLRLAADIQEMRGAFSSKVNMLLVNQKASDMNDFDASTTTLWNARRDMAPGTEAEFANYVKNQQTVLSFEGLRAFHTTLMGDGIASTGLIDAVADSLNPNETYKVDDLGKVVLHARTVQLEAFSVLSQAWAGSFWNLESLRKELFANLQAQEQRFFDRMAIFNASYIRSWTRGGGNYDLAANLLFRSEPVASNWNLVPDGARLDVTPLVSVVDASYVAAGRSWNVTGSIAMQCNRQGICEMRFSAGQMAPYAAAQGQLAVSYRCEGLPAVKSVTVNEANGKAFTLSCTTLDTLAGQYTNELGQILTFTRESGGSSSWMRASGTGNPLEGGACSIDPATGSVACVNTYGGADERPTITPVVDASTELPSLTWNGKRWTAIKQ